MTRWFAFKICKRVKKYFSASNSWSSVVLPETRFFKGSLTRNPGANLYPARNLPMFPLPFSL